MATEAGGCLMARTVRFDASTKTAHIEVVSEAVAEQAAFVVCASTSHFVDDVHTNCAGCQKPIVHRPHAPLTPPKICITCAVAFAGGSQH